MQQQELGLSFLFHMLELFALQTNYIDSCGYIYLLVHSEQTLSVVLFCNESLYFDDKFGITF